MEVTSAIIFPVAIAIAGMIVEGHEPVDQPPIPFTRGQIRIVEQIGSDGRSACFVRYEPVDFAIAAVRHCAQQAVIGVRSEPIADPAVETTTVIRIIPAGTAGDWPAEHGRVMTAEEAELAVRPDGSIATCRSLSRVDRGEPSPWADGVCASLGRSGARPFLAADVESLRRGTIQVGYYVAADEAIRTARQP